MLTKRIFQSLGAIVIVCFISACATSVKTADAKCAKKGDRGVKLTIAEYQLGVDTKKTFCVEIGNAYNIPIKIPGYSDYKLQAGHVTAGQKSGAPFVITGSNSADPKILTITTSNFASGAGDEKDCGDASGDECAKFWIKVTGVGELDPMVRVVGNNFAN